MYAEQNTKMDSLRDQIHQILLENSTPLEQKLRSQTLSNCTVEQLFEAISEEYKQKQNQVSTMGKLIFYTIDLLQQEVNDKNEIMKEHDQIVQDYKIQQQDSNLHIEQCQAALQDYKDKIEQLELELSEVKQLRQRYQTMYEQQLNYKSVTYDTFDSSKQVESFQISKVQDQRHKMEISLLQYQLKQVKLEVGRKDAQILQKQQLRNHLNDRVKGQMNKNQALQSNFKVLQQNFRALVLENDTLKRNMEQMEDNFKNIEIQDNKDKRKRIDSFDNKEKDKSNVEKDFSQYMQQDKQSLLRRSVSQANIRKKGAQVSITQPKKSLAFDLQSLHSGTSMVSPLASQIGKPSLFLQGNRNKSNKGPFANNFKSPLSHRKRSRTPSEISHSPHRMTVTPKKQVVVKQPPSSIFRKCLQTIISFLVHDRLSR